MVHDRSWKRTEEVEVDVFDLLHKLCLRWKQIAACALLAAILMGGIGWIRNRSYKEEAVSLEAIELTENEKQAVADAVALAQENEALEEYMENSILMQIDPYRKNRVVSLYGIRDASRKTLPEIVESYLTFLASSGITDAMMANRSDALDLEERYFLELISAVQKSDGTYQVSMDGSDDNVPDQTLLYVEVVGIDAEMAWNFAQNVQKALEDYTADVNRKCGSHRLSLVSMQESIRIDNGLLTQQRDKRMLLSSNRTSLKALKDLFSDEQKQVYGETLGEEMEEKQDGGVETSGGGIRLKYILFGIFCGIFLYSGIYSCWYLLNGTIKNTAEFKTNYTFPFLGDISVGKSAQMLLERLRFVCRKQGVTRLCLATDFILEDKEREYLKSIVDQLLVWGVDAEIIENIVENASSWDTVSDKGVVLVVSRIGKTTRRTIDEEMEFYLENGITVLGAAALE